MMAGSTGSGSDFKGSQKTGIWLSVSSDMLGEARNRTRGPLVYKAKATGDVILFFVAVFLGYNQYWLVGFMVFQEHLMLNG